MRECEQCVLRDNCPGFYANTGGCNLFQTERETAKADEGKPQVHLVPMQIVSDIARVREYGTRKYKREDNWLTVESIRYVDALIRHALKFANDPYGVDEESGLPHLWHIECNAAFLSEMEKERWTDIKPKK